MKRKELYAYIREQIINELTPAELNDKKIKTDNANKAIAKLTQRLGTEKDPDAKKEVQADLVVAKEKLANANAMKESELEEMASYKFFRVADRAKFDALKDIYAGAVEEKILDAIAAAGEQGITQANLASELQMASALINPILKKFGSINAITLPVSEKPGKATAEEPEVEEPETEEPETPESDFFMSDKDSEEEKDMEPIDEPSEPSAADIDSELLYQKEILIKKGKIYNSDLIDKTVDRMVEVMSDNSYAFANRDETGRSHRIQVEALWPSLSMADRDYGLGT